MKRFTDLQQIMEHLDGFIRKSEKAVDHAKIPEAIKYITMDRNGTLYGWSHKPRISHIMLEWAAVARNSEHRYLARIDPTGLNWKLCCISIPIAWRERSRITQVEPTSIQTIHEVTLISAPDAWI